MQSTTLRRGRLALAPSSVGLRVSIETGRSCYEGIDELHVEVNPGVSVFYRGTEAQMRNERGLIPAGVRWPSDKLGTSWQANDVHYNLRRGDKLGEWRLLAIARRALDTTNGG